MKTILISTFTGLLGIMLTVMISPQIRGRASEGAVLRDPTRIPDDQISEYWRLTNAVNLAQIALDRTAEAQKLKEAFDHRNQLLGNLSRLCEARKLSLTSATGEQASKLGVSVETPICSKKP